MTERAVHDDRVAPDPEDPRKPDTPREVSKRSWTYVFRKTFREFIDDECQDSAAALTYYGVLAIFPGLLALTSLLALVGQGGGAIDALLGVMEGIAPPEVLQVLSEPYVGAFGRAMNRIYEIEEGRPFWKLRPMQLAVTVAAVVMVAIIAVILVVSGPVTDAIGSALGLGESVRVVWEIAKWPILVVLVILIIALLYHATPNAKQPKFRWVSLGALLAIVVLLIASAGFALYVANFSNYDRTYGSLAGAIVFLLWLWIANNALLFGAEFDAEIERGRQLEAGIEAEERIQLPPRDTRKIDKAEAKEKEDIELGRRIRESHAGDAEREAAEEAQNSARAER
jgi:membrane protein